MASTYLLGNRLAGLIDMTMSKAHDFVHRSTHTGLAAGICELREAS